MRDWSVRTGVVRAACCVERETYRLRSIGSSSLIRYNSPPYVGGYGSSYVGGYGSFDVGAYRKL